MQHTEVAPLSRRGGQHKPICVSLWPFHRSLMTGWFLHSAKKWVGPLDFVLLALGISWYQGCWSCSGSFWLQYIWTQVLASVTHPRIKILLASDLSNHSQKSVQRIRKDLGLKGTIQQAATFETITQIYEVLQARFPTMGACWMVTVIRQEYSIRVSEYNYSLFLMTDLNLCLCTL